MNQRQFGLEHLLWAITFFSALFALTIEGNELVQLIAGAVLAANVMGAIAALFITHSLGFPRDGSYRHENRSLPHNDEVFYINDESE